MPETKRRTITVDAVFDIETENWTRFVCGGFLLADGRYEEYRHEKNGEQEMLSRILSFVGTVWAHNGGGFDFKWLLDEVVKRGLQARVTSAGGTIISVQIGKLRLFDSYALTKISLENLTKGLDRGKTETGLVCICGGFCGGYCAIRRNMPASDYRLLLEYLKRDCEGLFDALAVLQQFAADNDLDLGATVGGSAWRNAQRLLELPNATLETSDHMFIRDSYFGGRVQLFRPISPGGWEYDVCSMYPSRLAYCRVPVGNPVRNWGDTSRRLLDECAPGFYFCQINVPADMHLPPLPVRTRERVIYPVGTFRGTWALPELMLAQELGCTVEPIESLTYPDEKVIFKDWIDRLFHVRANAPGGKKGPMGTFVKYYLNSLTGKFGSRPEAERVMINLPTKLLRSCRCKTPCNGLCGCDQPIGMHGQITIRKTFRIDNCAHIEWASYLTSEARVEWLRGALSTGNGGKSVVYGDTDSIFSEVEMTRNPGSELGQWECSGPYHDFEGIAPKVYSFVRGEKRTLKAKGVPLPSLKTATEEYKQNETKLNFTKIVNGGTFRKDGPTGFRSGVKNGLFFAITNQSRSVSRGFGDRHWTGETSYTIPPVYTAAIHGSAESDDADTINPYEKEANEEEDW